MFLRCLGMIVLSDIYFGTKNLYIQKQLTAHLLNFKPCTMGNIILSPANATANLLNVPAIPMDLYLTTISFMVGQH